MSEFLARKEDVIDFSMQIYLVCGMLQNGNELNFFTNFTKAYSQYEAELMGQKYFEEKYPDQDLVMLRLEDVTDKLKQLVDEVRQT